MGHTQVILPLTCATTTAGLTQEENGGNYMQKHTNSTLDVAVTHPLETCVCHESLDPRHDAIRKNNTRTQQCDIYIVARLVWNTGQEVLPICLGGIYVPCKVRLIVPVYTSVLGLFWRIPI